MSFTVKTGKDGDEGLMARKRRRLSKVGKCLALLFLLLLMATVIFLLVAIKRVYTKNEEAETITATAILPTEEAVIDEPEVLNEDYETKAEINPEYIGVLKFESGIIEQNVVQNVENNTKYERTSWDLQESSQGAAFIDYRNSFTDQNIMIYGHYVYYDDSAMFSKLELLMEESNYEKNKNFTLTIGADEIRHYVITDVFYYQVSTDSPDYHEPNYTEEEFNVYYSQVKETEFYDTGETLAYDDCWITLQTCVRNHDELREIVIAREVKE